MGDRTAGSSSIRMQWILWGMVFCLVQEGTPVGIVKRKYEIFALQMRYWISKSNAPFEFNRILANFAVCLRKRK